MTTGDAKTTINIRCFPDMSTAEVRLEIQARELAMWENNIEMVQPFE